MQAEVRDRSSGLPPEAAPLIRARAGAMGVPSHDGDSVVMRRKLPL
jgi:hypothetical protein